MLWFSKTTTASLSVKSWLLRHPDPLGIMFFMADGLQDELNALPYSFFGHTPKVNDSKSRTTKNNYPPYGGNVVSIAVVVCIVGIQH